jgi:putative phage-type endonuclease
VKILELGQNSVEWLSWRALGVGASDAPVIMGVDLYRQVGQVLQDKAGTLKKVADTSSQKWGHDTEPVARRLYEELTGIKTRPVCVIHDKHDWLRASLDGLSLDNKVILEIKCVRQEFHDMALAGRVPPQYIPQVQHQLMTAGLEVLHYWSFNRAKRYRPIDQVALVEVTPDLKYQKALFKAEREFWAQVQALAGQTVTVPTSDHTSP